MNVGSTTKSRARVLAAGAILLISTSLAAAKLKKIKPADNPSGYDRFCELLSKQDRFHHALDRLTYGPRTRDFEEIRRIGIDKWVNLQLHPEKVPENPILEKRLAPLESLRMSIQETYVHYPPPRILAAVAQGRGRLPDDPELRATILRLAHAYLEKKDRGAESEDDGVGLKLSLNDILSPEEIKTLQAGTAAEKKQVLASLPAGERRDFVWALEPRMTRQLLVLAPVSLRRDLMLSLNPQNVVANDLSEGKLLRAVYSTHQLEELLVEFWYNHFNVFFGKGGDGCMIPAYERDAIRPNVFGKFQDLLLETAKSPAMLFYLDNWQSVSADSAADPKRIIQKNKRGLNENYARELLELHTLGVDGGYTQKDVIEVARCFTGWTIAPAQKGGGFLYNDKVHDKGRKVVLGREIPPGGGMSDGLEVLDILAHHPSTARHICLELAQRFVADDPPPSLVNKMAATFMQKDGDLREVIRTMLGSPEFWSQGAYHAKIKTPLEMVVSAVRASDADVTSGFALSNELQKMGEPLYRKVEPTGYSTANAEWVSSSGLLARMNFALALTHNRVPGVTVESAALQRFGAEDTREQAGLTFGSPEFQRH